MSVFDGTAKIKITFDRPIVSDVEIITGSESYTIPKEVRPVGFDEGHYSNNDAYLPKYAFDGLTSGNNWLVRYAPFVLGANFCEPVTTTKARLYISSGACPNGYTLYASNDGTTWDVISTGNFPNTSGWQEVAFSEVTYQYWKFVFSSKYNTYIGIYEMDIGQSTTGTRNIYDVSGWSVTAQEYDKIPGGVAGSVTYDIRRISKADDDYSIILWLKLKDRIAHPIGNVTVNFFGSMQGPGAASVAPFSLSFTPADTAPFFKPHDLGLLTFTPELTVTRLEITRISCQETDLDAITFTPVMTIVRTHINDLPE